MGSNMEKNLYLAIYKASLKNGTAFLKEAKILFDNECYARSYFLAYSRLEEISKSQMAADVYTGYKDESFFKELYRNHKKKVERVKWAHLDSLDFSVNGYMIKEITGLDFQNIEEPTFEKRQMSMYIDVDLKTNKIYNPLVEFSEKEAFGVIHILETAISRIYEMVEDWGHQIGTKGFMK